MKIPLLMAAVFFASCNPNPVPIASLKDSIQGVWLADTNDLSAVIEIQGDTHIDIEHMERTPIRVQDNRLVCLMEDTVSYAIAMRGLDTLVFLPSKSDPKPTVLFRWNNADEDSIRGVKGEPSK